MIEETKECKKCKQALPLSSYYKERGGSYRLKCKPCTYEENRERYHNNPSTKEAHRKAAERYRIKSYGISVDEHDKLLKLQKNACAICGKTSSSKLAIDHCHKTGKVRALLCNGCNTSLGNVNESIDVLKKMIEYLEKHNENLGI